VCTTFISSVLLDECSFRGLAAARSTATTGAWPSPTTEREEPRRRGAGAGVHDRHHGPRRGPKNSLFAGKQASLVRRPRLLEAAMDSSALSRKGTPAKPPEGRPRARRHSSAQGSHPVGRTNQPPRVLWLAREIPSTAPSYWEQDVTICPSCGQQSPVAARFCLACGTRLAEEEATRREVRKIVTVVFSDVASSTELGERLDPESLRRAMGRYFDEMREARVAGDKPVSVPKSAKPGQNRRQPAPHKATAQWRGERASRPSPAVPRIHRCGVRRPQGGARHRAATASTSTVDLGSRAR